MNFLARLFQTSFLILFLMGSLFSEAAEEGPQGKTVGLGRDPIDACIQAHREGYDLLYEFLAHSKSSELHRQMPWWPLRDLNVSNEMLRNANQTLIQFKNPIKAIITHFGAPGYFRAFELKVQSVFPRLSHFVAYQGLRAFMSPPQRLEHLDRMLKDNPDNIDDGPLDARRHGIWSAFLARYLGPGIAFCMLSLHEIDNAKTGDESFFKGRSVHDTSASMMDFMNNAKGVALGMTFQGTDSELAKAVEDSVWRGDFVILNPHFEVVPMRDWLQRARAQGFRAK